MLAAVCFTSLQIQGQGHLLCWGQLMTEDGPLRSLNTKDLLNSVIEYAEEVDDYS